MKALYGILLVASTLAGSALRKSDSFYERGKVVGARIDSPTDPLPLQDIIPLMVTSDIFVVLSAHEPADKEFKEWFNHLRSFCEGVRDTKGLYETSKKGQALHLLAALVAESPSIGQLFMHLSRQFSLLAKKEINLGLGKNLIISTSDSSFLFWLGHLFMKKYLALLVDYSRIGSTHDGTDQTYLRRVLAVGARIYSTATIVLNPSIIGVNRFATAVFNIINGMKSAFKDFPLEDELKDSRPARALIVRFIVRMTEIILTMPDAAIKGNMHPFADVAEECYAFGQELEAIS
jgi:hypothetical protein